jgi:hypothetical protein
LKPAGLVFGNSNEKPELNKSLISYREKNTVASLVNGRIILASTRYKVEMEVEYLLIEKVHQNSNFLNEHGTI